MALFFLWLLYTKTSPALAAANCAKNHWHELEPQTPIRSPRIKKPSQNNPAAIVGQPYKKPMISLEFMRYAPSIGYID